MLLSLSLRFPMRGTHYLDDFCRTLWASSCSIRRYLSMPYSCLATLHVCSYPSFYLIVQSGPLSRIVKDVIVAALRPTFPKQVRECRGLSCSFFDLRHITGSGRRAEAERLSD
jgi:hypothetical protein